MAPDDGQDTGRRWRFAEGPRPHRPHGADGAQSGRGEVRLEARVRETGRCVSASDGGASLQSGLYVAKRTDRWSTRWEPWEGSLCPSAPHLPPPHARFPLRDFGTCTFPTTAARYASRPRARPRHTLPRRYAASLAGRLRTRLGRSICIGFTGVLWVLLVKCTGHFARVHRLCQRPALSTSPLASTGPREWWPAAGAGPAPATSDRRIPDPCASSRQIPRCCGRWSATAR